MDRCWLNWPIVSYSWPSGLLLFQAIAVIIFIGRPATASSFWNYGEAVTTKSDEDLDVSCTFEGIKRFLDVVRIVHIQDASSRPISDNGDVKRPYSQLPRYNVTYRHSGSRATVTVSYRGIQPEDGGRLKCERLDFPEESSFLNITVLAPVNDLYVVAVAVGGFRTRADDETVFLEENKKLGVGCVALMDGNAKSAPQIHVSIGDRDVTSTFASAVKTTSVELENELRLSKSEISAVLSTDRPDPDFNHKTIRCSITHLNRDLEASALLEVKYAPVIACSDIEWKARVGDQVRIGCNVKAYPSSRIKWEFASDFDEELSEQENIIFSRTNVSEDRSHVDMIIDNIKESQFRHYHLKAENEIGTRNASLLVTRMSDPVPEPSHGPDPEHQSDRDDDPEPLQPKQEPVREQGNDANRLNVFAFILLFHVTIVTIIFDLVL